MRALSSSQGGARRGLVLAALLASSLLAGCSSLPSFLGGGSDAPKPAPLAPNPLLLGVRQAWTAPLGPVSFPLSVQVQGDAVVLGADDGTVAALDAASGRELWRAQAGAPLSAGVGSDGKTTAVVPRNHDLVGGGGGKAVSRERLRAQAFTAPLVAGERVFVLAADRSVSAYDGATGRRLWTQERTGEPLVLRQAGLLLAVGDTLVAGQGGRLVGLNPLNGSIRWEAPIGTSRGTNDIERLVDLVGGASRNGNSVCARAFQTAVGCVDAERGTLAWTRPSNGATGVHGDEARVYGTESDGKLVAWRRDKGERAWSVDTLLHRDPTAPLVIGRSVAVGDGFGFVHLLSREDGRLLNRLSTDGSAIAATPVLAGNTLVVVTRKGAVHGFVPQ